MALLAHNEYVMVQYEYHFAKQSKHSQPNKEILHMSSDNIVYVVVKLRKTGRAIPVYTNNDEAHAENHKFKLESMNTGSANVYAIREARYVTEPDGFDPIEQEYLDNRSIQ